MHRYACGAAMNFTHDVQRVRRLGGYRALQPVLQDPYDIDVRQAKQLLARHRLRLSKPAGLAHRSDLLGRWGSRTLALNTPEARSP
jgi:hypothetical protein